LIECVLGEKTHSFIDFWVFNLIGINANSLWYGRLPVMINFVNTFAENVNQYEYD